MPDMATTKTDVSAAAAKAKKVVSDGTVIERHGVKDLLEVDDRVSSTDAVKSKGRGLVLTRTKPPGTA